MKYFISVLCILFVVALITCCSSTDNEYKGKVSVVIDPYDNTQFVYFQTDKKEFLLKLKQNAKIIGLEAKADYIGWNIRGDAQYLVRGEHRKVSAGSPPYKRDTLLASYVELLK